MRGITDSFRIRENRDQKNSDDFTVFPNHSAWGHSIITFSGNDQNLDLPLPLVCTCSNLVTPPPILQTFKTLHQSSLLPPPPLPNT